MSDAYERWIRYANTIVAEIDLTEGTAEQRKELGHALQLWEEQHPEISEIKGLNELLGGHYPPLVPSGPIYPGMAPNIDCPVIIRSEPLPKENSTHTKETLVRSLEALLPKATVHRISVGQAERGY
jgi:hypothetical protein